MLHWENWRCDHHAGGHSGYDPVKGIILSLEGNDGNGTPLKPFRIPVTRGNLGGSRVVQM